MRTVVRQYKIQPDDSGNRFPFPSVDSIDAATYYERSRDSTSLEGSVFVLLNQARACDYMRRCDLDVLVATSPVNITYLTDYYCWLDSPLKEYMITPGAGSNRFQTYAVLPLEGEPALVVRPVFAVNASEIWVRDIHLANKLDVDHSQPSAPTSSTERRFLQLLNDPKSAGSPNQALLTILKSRGLSQACIGLEMEGLSEQAKDFITTSLPRAQLKDCSNLVRLIRTVKSDQEIKWLTRSAEITERAGLESLALIRPGLPISQLIEEFRRSVARAGAEFDHFSYSINGLGIATEPIHRLSETEVALVDFGCIYQHYFSDTGLTFAMSALHDSLHEKHQALRDGVAAGMQAVRPGVKASAVHAAMNQALAEHEGIVSSPIGHSLGLEVREYPMILPDNGLRIRDDCVDEPSDLPLEVDMVFNLESTTFMPTVGALHIEQTFLVTEDGCQLLVDQDRGAPFRPEAVV